MEQEIKVGSRVRKEAGSIGAEVIKREREKP